MPPPPHLPSTQFKAFLLHRCDSSTLPIRGSLNPFKTKLAANQRQLGPFLSAQQPQNNITANQSQLGPFLLAQQAQNNITANQSQLGPFPSAQQAHQVTVPLTAILQPPNGRTLWRLLLLCSVFINSLPHCGHRCRDVPPITLIPDPAPSDNNSVNSIAHNY